MEPSTQDPKQHLKKLLKDASYLTDPSKASHGELVAHTDLMETGVQTLDEIKKAIPTKMKVSIEGAELLTIKGEKGEKPTEQELLKLIKPLIPEPIKGDDGKTPTEEELLQIIEPLIPEPIPGKPGKPGMPGETPDIQDIVKEVLKQVKIPDPIPGKDAKTPKVLELVKSVIEEIKKSKSLDISNIRNTESIISAAGKVNSGSFMFNGTRYQISELMHGGSHNKAGGFTILTASGVVDGSNTIFGFSTEPSLIISDGISLTRLDNNLGVQWVWNSVLFQATMSVPPLNSILGIQ